MLTANLDAEMHNYGEVMKTGQVRTCLACTLVFTGVVAATVVTPEVL